MYSKKVEGRIYNLCDYDNKLIIKTNFISYFIWSINIDYV